jgi:hypothetical protein
MIVIYVVEEVKKVSNPFHVQSCSEKLLIVHLIVKYATFYLTEDPPL